ncbi:hypothetical protein ACFOWM_13815 [Ferruginibacter yonginensis]|uniref:Uncharacterized protein n=1 Tax=Ferruginibacter yonginensis TaxID=1310416 RepID=A0ABV8QVS7_9BACT
MDTLTKPRSFLLVLFGLFTTTVLLFALYRISLPFYNFYKYYLLIYIAIPLLSILAITIFLDKKYNFKMKRYSILAIILFLICIAIFPKFKNYIILDTEIKAEKLVIGIQQFRIKYGYWPTSIDDNNFDVLSKKAFFNRPFYYSVERNYMGDSVAIIKFYSFDGLEAKLIFDSSTNVLRNKIEWNYSD